MPKIGDLVSILQVGNKTYQKPQYWSTKHKLKKTLKMEQLCKLKVNLNSSYRVNSNEPKNGIQTINKYNSSLVNLSEDKELAPWAPELKRFKTLILFK